MRRSATRSKGPSGGRAQVHTSSQRARPRTSRVACTWVHGRAVVAGRTRRQPGAAKPRASSTTASARIAAPLHPVCARSASRPGFAPMTDDQRRARLEKLEKLRALGVTPYADRFDCTHVLADAAQLPDGSPVRVAGRLLTLRSFGKLAFAHLMDRSGRAQVSFERGTLSAADEAVVRLLDLGDFVGIEASFGPPGWASARFAPVGSRFSPRACGRCRRSGTGSRTRSCATAAATSTRSEERR